MQCISGSCSGGRCVGAGLNEPCVLEGDDVITMAGSQLTFTPGQNVRYQNTCGVYEGVALYCELKHEGGVQKSVCSLPKKVHERCFAYEIDLQLLSKANNHTYVSNAMLASMYSGCEGGSICFVDVHLKGLTFTGECRPMFATLPGETCLEDHECEPPYRCIGGTATQYGTCSSNSVCGADDDWRCSQNERCQCADEGTGARGLVTVLERTLRGHKFALPSSSLKSFILDNATVSEPAAALAALLDAEPPEDKLSVRLSDVKRFEARLRRQAAPRSA